MMNKDQVYQILSLIDKQIIVAKIMMSTFHSIGEAGEERAYRDMVRSLVDLRSAVESELEKYL